MSATLAPIAAIAKCDFCGGTARLDHLRPDPVKPLDHFVYRCTSCSGFTIVERPRPSATVRNTGS
jgi:hypothetical protein